MGLHYSYGAYNTMTYPTMTMNMGGMDMSMMGPGVPTKGSVNSVELFGRFNLPASLRIEVDALYRPISFWPLRLTHPR